MSISVCVLTTMDFKSYIKSREYIEVDGDVNNINPEGSEAEIKEPSDSDEEKQNITYFNPSNRFPPKHSNQVDNDVYDTVLSKPPRYVPKKISIPSASENTEENYLNESPTSETGDKETGSIQYENIPIINTRALSKTAKTYELEKFEKKALIIFNHFNINGYKVPRHGTHEDVEALKVTFEKLGFDVAVHTDYTRAEIFAELKSFTSKNFVDYGCVAVAVLTHGSHHGLLMAKDHDYSEQVIIEHLKVHNNPTLLTKPKMVIIQACRGDRSQKGVEVHQGLGRVDKDAFDDVEHYSLPIAADMVIVHSTFVGNPANRCPITGSWFIQTFCEKIDCMATEMDFEAIFKEVQRTIAIEKSNPVYNKSTQEIDINKQMPMIASSLIRKLYLRRYLESLADTSSFQMIQEPLTPATPVSATLSDEPSSSTPRVAFSTQVTLHYFEYLKECLRLYMEESPDDKIALSLLLVAETFGTGKKFKEPKKKMCSAICQHLSSNSEKIAYYKYLFICEMYMQ